MFEVNIGENIRRIRKDQGMTQLSLAKKVECEPSLLSHIERNTRPLRAESLIKLGRALNVHPALLITQRDSPLYENLLILSQLNEEGVQRVREYMEFLLSRQRI